MIKISSSLTWYILP